jgi:hypothetical protein
MPSRNDGRAYSKLASLFIWRPFAVPTRRLDPFDPAQPCLDKRRRIIIILAIGVRFYSVYFDASLQERFQADNESQGAERAAHPRPAKRTTEIIGLRDEQEQWFEEGLSMPRPAHASAEPFRVSLSGHDPAGAGRSHARTVAPQTSEGDPGQCAPRPCEQVRARGQAVVCRAGAHRGCGCRRRFPHAEAHRLPAARP